MSAGGMKKLLMLCYHYPPSASGGVARSTRFVRHLPSLGWNPIVLTTKRYGDTAGCAGERVVRARGLFVKTKAARSGQVNTGQTVFAIRNGPLARFIEKWLLIPDKHVRWTMMAAAPALHILRREKVDAIYSTSPPESVHVLGLALKRLTGIPWIMDLRDPWTLEPLRWYLREPGARLALERRIERLAIDGADAIVMNTDEAASAYRERYPRAAPRIHAITNGFDAADFPAGGPPREPGGRPRSVGDGAFLVSHVGTFGRHSDVPAYPLAFIEAVRRLAEEGAVSPRTFRILFAGAVHPAARREIERSGLGGIVSLTGVVPRAEALRIMRSSDLLLLYDPATDERHYVRGKLYEYLAAGAWILGLVPEGPTRRLLERSGHGILVPANDAEGIRRELRRLLAERTRPVTSPGFAIDSYEGAALSAALARVLAAAVGAGR